MTEANLTKKQKKGLFIAAGVIILAWSSPILISAAKNNIKEDKGVLGEENQNQRIAESPAITALRKYLEDLKIKPMEELEDILGIKDPILNGYEIAGLSGNNERVVVETKIFIYNSYINRQAHLSKNNDVWGVEKLEGPDYLTYERNNISVRHSQEWEAYSTSGNPQDLTEWTLNKKTGDLQIMFFIEPEDGDFYNALTTCSFEEITNCSQEDVGNYTYYTGIYLGVLKVFLLKGQGSNLIVMTAYTEDTAEEVDGIISTIQVGI